MDRARLSYALVIAAAWVASIGWPVLLLAIFPGALDLQQVLVVVVAVSVILWAGIIPLIRRRYIRHHPERQHPYLRLAFSLVLLALVLALCLMSPAQYIAVFRYIPG